MSYGIIRVQKMTAGSVKGIEIHDLREKDHSHSNPDIDFNQSEQNYQLHDRNEEETFRQQIKQRISELNLKRAVRKDAIVMSQILVTSDKDFFEGISQNEQEQFFKDSYEFIADRYGKENIISATVHLDERTPHLHVNLVPVTEDGRLSAKEIHSRGKLIYQQDDFHREVGEKYGLERGKRSEGKARHLSVADYKQETERRLEHAKKDLEAVTAKIKAGERILENNPDINFSWQAVQYRKKYELSHKRNEQYAAFIRDKGLTNEFNKIFGLDRER